MTRPKPREAIQRMAPYKPPTGGRGGRLRLDFNENTIGPSPRVLERLREATAGDFLTVYPEYEVAREKMATFFGVTTDQIVFCDGTDEGIHILVQAYVEPGDEVLIPWPTFPMYKFYAETAGAEPVLVHRDPETLDFPTEALLKRIGPKTKAILIANPNNPTGGAAEPEELQRVLEAAPEAAVLIDEAYFEFYGETALPWLTRYGNLFVSRTFSKAWGLAGLRVGCLFSQAENAQWVRRGQSPYSLNSVGVECALAALEDREYVENYVREVVASRATLEAALDDLGIKRWTSEANFVLARFADPAMLCRALRDRGVLVRDRGHEVPGGVRLGVGTAEQTGRLVAALREVLT